MSNLINSNKRKINVKPKHEVSINEIEGNDNKKTFNVNIKIDNTVTKSISTISNLRAAPNKKETVTYLVQQFHDNIDSYKQSLFDLQVDVLNKKDAKLHESN